MSREFDIIIFGASGFTGQFVVEHLARALIKEQQELRFAVAGRSESKINSVLQTASEVTGIDLKNIPFVSCNISDEESIINMAKRTRLVLNCVGPYRFYGESVVKACVNAGTHHIDISGEPAFLEKMQLDYDVEAKKNDVYVIGACGFDSIPSDLGHMYLREKMDGDVNDVEMYLKVTGPKNVKGPMINYATWESLINGISKAHELGPLRKRLFANKLPRTQPKLQHRGACHYNKEVGSWCVPFPGSDTSVMKRTQRFLYEYDNKRPAQIAAYAQMPSFFKLVLLIIFFAIIQFLAKYEFGRHLLEEYPGFFSFGLVSKEGPSKEMMADTDFLVTLIGHGWDTESMVHDNPPDREVIVTVSGKNIGYGSTCELMVQSGIVLLTEPENIPSNGGVMTPGFAFKDTSLVSRLQRNNIPFTSKVTGIISN